MKHTITFIDAELFEKAVNVLALHDVGNYETDNHDLTIFAENVRLVMDVLIENEIEGWETDAQDDERMYPGEDMDGDFDSGMASAGHGTDEDYEHKSFDEGGE